MLPWKVKYWDQNVADQYQANKPVTSTLPKQPATSCVALLTGVTTDITPTRNCLKGNCCKGFGY